MKWKWDAKNLFRHLEVRKDKGLGVKRRFFHGNSETLADMVRKVEYTDVRFEFWIVQPGLTSRDLPEELASILMSCAATIADMSVGYGAFPAKGRR